MKKLSFLALCATALLMGFMACTSNQNNNPDGEALAAMQ